MTDVFHPTGEQRAIIDHPLEPLRVAAGAGTGKTTTIVKRLARAVRDGLEPEAALGITFTNKAAEELADRLRRELGDLAAEGREVEVTTYHGFALHLLTEFGAIVGIDSDPEVVGPGYVRQLVHESVGRGPYHHLDLTALPWRIDEAANLGSQAAANLLEPEDVIAAAPSSPDDVWAARLELARIVAAYRDTKRRLGVVDYGDLILLAHRLVTRAPELAGRIRDRYHLVLLDEYQDTDPGQRELLRTIFGGGFPVTAVGDTDQTIYEWRGASLDNFRSFVRHFPRDDGGMADTLPLTLNRRSGSAILGVANDVRAVLHGAPPADPLRPTGDIADSVAYGWFRTAHEEAAWMAGEVRRLHDEESVGWRDIAVLFRRSRSISVVRDALHEAEIPFEVASLGGLLDVPEVADVHAWLRLLGRPDDSVALARILLGSRYRLGLGDLAPIAAWVRRVQRTMDDDGDVSYPLVEAIDRLPEVPGVHREARRRLTQFRTLYRRLLADGQGITLVELVRRVVDGVDGWSEIEAMPPAAALSARLNLYRFLDLVEDWSPLAGRPSLEGFLGYLDLLQEDRSGDELDTARIGGGDAVSLLTVHRAKGLEWEAVFVPALAHTVFPSRSLGFDDPVAGPKWLPHELRLDGDVQPEPAGPDRDRKDVLRARHHAQELRTAYVAVTRAKRRLYMTGAAWTGAAKAKAPSELLHLVRSRDDAEEIRWVDDPGPPPDVVAGDPVEPPDPHFPHGWRQTLRDAIADPASVESVGAPPEQVAAATTQLILMLEALPTERDMPPPAEPTTSVTGLVTLASCPKRFYWSEVDPLPRRPTRSLRRGTEVHRRIELHHRGVTPFEDVRPDAPLPAESAPAAAMDPFAVFQRSRFAEDRPILVETPIDLVIAGTRVRGRIDAVFSSEPGSWEIVDYKSGGPSDDPASVVQLEAYAIAALDGGVTGGPPNRLRVTFAYLGVDPIVERSHHADEEWIVGARRRLDHLAAAARGDVFTATPSAACRYCDFVSFCDAGRTWIDDH